MITLGIILVLVMIVIVFGIYWHALRISQNLTKCLALLEKIVEGMKR